MQWEETLDRSGEQWNASRDNHDRARWAEAAVVLFREVCVGDMDETALYDLVANMGHLCDRLTAEYEDFEMTFNVMLERARFHYEDEAAEEVDDEPEQLLEAG
jgi:hypothetical protein